MHGVYEIIITETILLRFWRVLVSGIDITFDKNVLNVL